MKIKNILPLGASVMAFAFFFTACNKEVSTTDMPQEEAQTLAAITEEDATTDNIFTEIHEQELGVLEDLGLPGIGLNDEAGIGLDTVGRCVKITIFPRDAGVFPKTVTVDFGTGCQGLDGKVRKGKLITTYSAPMVNPGATAITRFDGFYVGGIKVLGKHTTKNNSTASVRIFTRTVQEGRLFFPNGDTLTWEGTHTNTQVAGLGTPGFPFDDAFTITGGAKGVRISHTGARVEWSRIIAEPLYKAFACRWISKGIVHITRNTNKAILNFGNGDCDNKAVLIINGVRKDITL